MPNHEQTRLHVTARKPEAIPTLMAFVHHYRNVDGYADSAPAGRFDEFTGEPIPTRMTEPCLSHAFCPRPLEYASTVSGTNRVEATDGRTWYEWSMENWGTKWGTYDESHEVGDDRIVISFSTAWSPPWELLKMMATAFGDLEFNGHYLSEYDGVISSFEVKPDEIIVKELGPYQTWPDDDYDSEPIQHFDMDGNRLETNQVK